MAAKKRVLDGVSAYCVQVVGRLIDDRRAHHDADDFVRQADAVMEQLLKLDIRDPAIGGTAARGAIEISVQVDATSVEEALQKGAAAIRTAIHAAGGGTPRWDVQFQGATTRRAGLVDASG